MATMASSDALDASSAALSAKLLFSPYPFAAAPDIIRAHQKDAYFQGVLCNQLADLLRRLWGARSAHAWAVESRVAADFLYLGLTILLGNRTLGEEYCHLVQVESPSSTSTNSTRRSRRQQNSANDRLHSPQPPPKSVYDSGPRLPSFYRRASYIVLSVLVPYLSSRLLPSVRALIRARLQSRLVAIQRAASTLKHEPSREYRIGRYILAHLAPLTSGSHIRALVLAVFYFGGAYYSLSKYLLGLRYVFSRRLPEHRGRSSAGPDPRAGYEVLGVLLLVQLAVRAWLHVRNQLSAHHVPSAEEILIEATMRERALPHAQADLSLDTNMYTPNNELLPSSPIASRHSHAALAATTHTPLPPPEQQSRYDLQRPSRMAWIKDPQQRKCTLCLEHMRDPAATQCGHVFCWACIGDWIREKPECPLCRRTALVQHVLPLRSSS